MESTTQILKGISFHLVNFRSLIIGTGVVVSDIYELAMVLHERDFSRAFIYCYLAQIQLAMKSRRSTVPPPRKLIAGPLQVTSYKWKVVKLFRPLGDRIKAGAKQSAWA